MFSFLADFAVVPRCWDRPGIFPASRLPPTIPGILFQPEPIFGQTFIFFTSDFVSLQTLCFIFFQNSSIGDLVPCLLAWAPLTIREFTTLQSDPRDLWPLRHLIRGMRRHNTTYLQFLMTIFDDNWEPEFMTIFFIWQSIVTLDSIRNSCDVFFVCWHKNENPNANKLSWVINYMSFCLC